MVNRFPEAGLVDLPPLTERGAPVEREEHCGVAVVRRIAALLDLDPDNYHSGGPLPRGWHFFMLAGDTRRSALRSDGFPGLGVPLPDLGLPRLMLGSRTVTYLEDIPIGAGVRRTSTVGRIEHKSTKAGPLALVTLVHELMLTPSGRRAVVESQTYLLMPPRGLLPAANRIAAAEPVTAAHTKVVVPDATMLFQYSALGFNSHRIHIDRPYAVEVEGFPDLVVNGGLVTLLLTEFLRCEIGRAPSSLRVRHVAPLYCNQPMTLALDPADHGWKLRAFDHQHHLAVDMEVSVP